MINSIHSIRFYNFALLDILGTLLFALISHRYFGYSLISQILFFFGLAIIIHYFLNIDTTLNYYLGISAKPTSFIEDPPILWISE